MSTTTVAGPKILPLYDVVVVGAGMIGSSAARHVTRTVQNGRRLTVCLVGPQEPTSRHVQTIFAAHYDEGRITRVTATDYVWSTLAKRSIDRYRQLERETGIRFYEERGCLTIGETACDFVASNLESATKCQGQELLYMSHEELLSRFPYLGIRGNNSDRRSIVDGDTLAILEKVDAGYINPRRLCLAQQTAAQRAGCHVIRDVVSDVTDDLRDDTVTMKVITEGGLVIRARKVLIATGAFTDFRRLLPPGVRLELKYMTQSVIFAELSPEDMSSMRSMPSMIVQSKMMEEKTELENDFHCYVLPPIQYPDGKTYLKLGHGSQLERPMSTPEEIIQWYRNPVPVHDQQVLHAMLQAVFPDLRPVSVHYDNCVTTHTPSCRPYIDLVTPSLGVALGGNGYAAKSSDEIGRIAADLLVSGNWSHDLPRDAFRPIRASKRMNEAGGTSKL